jgi:glycine/D-amino acid oxidase-like deaminating enzyme
VTDICIVGNGIIGLQAAYALICRDPNLSISVVGPRSRTGCASMAAAAMFNSYCEIDVGTFDNRVEAEKFEFNRLSNDRWRPLLERIADDSKRHMSFEFGTYLINNNSSDLLEDENFDEICAALDRYNEPYEKISPSEIPLYKPEMRFRATRSIFIPREGWVNPIELIEAIEVVLRRSGRVKFVDDVCLSVRREGDKVVEVVTEHSGSLTADSFLLCNGAAFSELVERSNLDIAFQRIFYGVGATAVLFTKERTIPNCIRTPNRGLACGLYAAPQSQTETIVGATNFISPEPVHYAKLTSLYSLLKSAMEQLNHSYHRDELIRINIGWRPTSSDTLPLLGETSISNLYVATGTKRDGLHCSPVIAEYLADLLLNGRSSYDFDLFRPERAPVKFLSRDSAIRTLVRHSLNAAYQHDFVPAKSRMTEEIESHYFREFTQLHDDVGAIDWGIPSELKDMYRYGHIK